MLNSQSTKLEVVNKYNKDNPLFQSILEISDEALFIVNKSDFKIIDCNKSALKLFEAESKDQLIELPMFKLYNLKPMDITLEKLTDDLRHKGEYTQELSFKTLKNNTFWGKMLQKIVSFSNIDFHILKINTSAGYLKEQEWLSEVLNVISKATGRSFFKELTKFLARTFNAKAAFITRRDPNKEGRLKIFYWHGETPDLKSISIKNSFVENSLKGFTSYYPTGLSELFPNDKLVAETGAVSFIGSPIYDANGKTLGVLGILNDKPMEELPNSRYMLNILSSRASSEMQRLRSQELLRQQTKELAEINLMKDKLISVITTDLHEPLNTILGYSEILKKKSGNYSAEEFVGKIAAMDHTLRNLYLFLNNINDWNKINQKDIKSTIKECHLQHIIDVTRSYYQYLADLKKVTVTNDLSGDSVVSADKYLLSVAIRNSATYLIKNTMKRGEVVYHVKECDKCWCLQIESNHFTGDVGDIDFCFTASQAELYNADKESSLPVLGLFIAREFMKLQNAQLSYIHENEHLTFKFEIPRVKN